jgi:hypothetical protein
MYAPIVIDDEEFMLRPMTCPHHFELYLSKPHSYRELPMRIAELAQLYRYEQSGSSWASSACAPSASLMLTSFVKMRSRLSRRSARPSIL